MTTRFSTAHPRHAISSDLDRSPIDLDTNTVAGLRALIALIRGLGLPADEIRRKLLDDLCSKLPRETAGSYQEETMVAVIQRGVDAALTDPP